MSEDWIRTLIAVNHSFSIERLSRFNELAVSLWRHTSLGTTCAIEYTNAHRELTHTERGDVLRRDNGLFFELRGAVAADCVVGLRAIAITLSDRAFAWLSRTSFPTDANELLALAKTVAASCNSSVLVVAPAERMAASAISELVCEGMTVEVAVQRMIEIHGQSPKGQEQLEMYFAHDAAHRIDQADTYFCVPLP